MDIDVCVCTLMCLVIPDAVFRMYPDTLHGYKTFAGWFVLLIKLFPIENAVQSFHQEIWIEPRM